MNSKKFDTRRLVLLALFTAIVVVLQLFGSFVRFGTFQIALVLAPIVIGAALLGVWSGVWLGFVFGLVVLLNGDAAAFLEVSPLGTVIAVLVKGAAAGLAAGLVYKAVERKNRFVAVVLAAIAAPVANTGVFILGSYLFFLPTLKIWAEGLGYANATEVIFLYLIGLNFFVELAVNLVLSGVIERIIRVGQKNFGTKRA
jgi:uncharacterized membrane protein